MRKFSILFTIIMMVFSVGIVMAQDTEETPEPETMPEMEVTEVPSFEQQGYIRIAHFAPETDAVDIYINDELVYEGVEYGQIGAWQVVPSGSHTLKITPTNSDTVAIETTIDAVTNQWRNIFVIGTGENVAVQSSPQVMETELPTTAQISFVNALSTGEGVNFLRDDVIFVANATSVNSSAEVQNNIPVDSREFVFGATLNGSEDALVETQTIDIVDTSSYLITVTGTPENPQFIIHETPKWEVGLLQGDIAAPATLYEALQAEPLAAPFLQAVEQAGLTELLQTEDNITVFVPADYIMDDVIANFDGTAEELATILRRHIVDTNYKAGDLFLQTPTLTTLDGESLSISQTEQGFVNGVQIIDVNVSGTNGTAHIINNVIE